MQRVAVVAQQDLGPGRDVGIHEGIVTAVVADVLDLHVAAEIIILQQRTAGLHKHARGRILESRADRPARPDGQVVFAHHVARVAGHAFGADECTGAGTEVAAAVLYEITDVLPTLFGQRTAVRLGAATVEIDHPETRVAVRVEEDAVLVDGAADQQDGLQHGVERHQLRAFRRTVLFQRHAEEVRCRKVRVGVQADAAVHEDVFVVAFGPGLAGLGGCRDCRHE